MADGTPIPGATLQFVHLDGLDRRAELGPELPLGTTIEEALNPPPTGEHYEQWLQRLREQAGKLHWGDA